MKRALGREGLIVPALGVRTVEDVDSGLMMFRYSWVAWE